MAMEKGSDGRWLVDGKPVVVQTTRDEDGLMYQSANIPDEDVASLVESHTFVDVQNQHGEQVQLSFCMDGWSLLVKDEKELQFEAMLRAQQTTKIQQPQVAADAVPDAQSGATQAQPPAQEESRTFATYIARVAAILAANPPAWCWCSMRSMARPWTRAATCTVSCSRSRAMKAPMNLILAPGPKTAGIAPLSSRPGGARTANPDAPQPGSCPAPCERQSWAGVAAAMPVATPKRYLALSLSASHLPGDDRAQAFQQSNFQFSDSGSMWIIPPAALRSDKTYLPGWACELMALADQHDARYLHFEGRRPACGKPACV
jgi:hypothetical protein